MVEIRTAMPADVDGVGALLEAVWPGGGFLPEVCHAQIAGQGGAALHIADVEGRVGGMVSAFPSAMHSRAPRWEVDLLAVHPDQRGQRLGTRLIEASIEVGRGHGCRQARAVVDVGNVASQLAFQRAGFAPSAEVHDLIIVSAGEENAPTMPPGWLLIPVQTLNYRGVWLEPGPPLSEAQQAGVVASVRTSPNGTAGVLLPQGAAWPTVLRGHGETVGTYHIWMKDL